jgi:DNA helicase-2/ATP-dependent DNA helicase PcrA
MPNWSGLQSNYTIIDTDDQLRAAQAADQAERSDEKRWPARQLAGLIDRWKNKGLNPPISTRARTSLRQWQGPAVLPALSGPAEGAERLRFRRLLLHMLNVLRTHRDVLEQYQQRFKYVMVDEYQDTNQVQYLWLRLLAQGRQNICVVGDDDQSIYSWRGAKWPISCGSKRIFPARR